ncbi:hypothetical protein SPLC1_S200530 [Arthrospira platensis C1]|nr:hypothetical protein SPLC1_S200530 [Arthrospira platensis C1]
MIYLSLEGEDIGEPSEGGLIYLIPRRGGYRRTLRGRVDLSYP